MPLLVNDSGCLQLDDTTGLSIWTRREQNREVRTIAEPPDIQATGGEQQVNEAPGCPERSASPRQGRPVPDSKVRTRRVPYGRQAAIPMTNGSAAYTAATCASGSLTRGYVVW